MADPPGVERLEYMSLSSLLRAPRNAKLHDLGVLHQSVTRFGYTAPLLMDERTGRLVAGHGRLDMLMQRRDAGDPPPERIQIAPDGDWLVPVIRGIAFTTDAEAEAYLLADNRTVELGGWDERLLTEMLQELTSTGEDALAGIGYDADDLDVLLAGVTAQTPQPEAPEPQLDRAEELRVKWGVEDSQLWEIGRHRLLCGDCRDQKAMSRLCSPQSCHLLCADPPYGLGKERDGIANDNLYREHLVTFHLAWFSVVLPMLMQAASCYIWGTAPELWRLWYTPDFQALARFTYRNEIVWDKGDGGMAVGTERGRSFQSSERCLFFMLGQQTFNENADNYWDGWEPIRCYLAEERTKMGWDIPMMKRIAGHSDLSRDHWTGKSQWSFPTREVYEKFQMAACSDAFKRDYDDLKRDYDDLKRDYYNSRAFFDQTHETMTDVWRFPSVSHSDRWNHPTPKPIAILERILKTSSQHAENILDPFCGSGTTLVACARTGRIGYGMEIDPGYCGVILERLSHMGLVPKLIA